MNTLPKTSFRWMPIGFIVIAVFLLQGCPAPQPRSDAGYNQQIDRVVVKKSARTMQLLSRGIVKQEFPIMLGKSPVGHKHREGDNRTPEGIYVLDWRNAQSSFYRSMHISYPNLQDRMTSMVDGVNPGGMVMVHGLPNHVLSQRVRDELLRTDWTNGCIALNNANMDKFWRMVPVGTTIEIRP